MKQNHFARKKRQLNVLAKNLQMLLSHHSEDALRQIEKLILKIKKLLNDIIHVFSQTELKKILGTAAIYLGISFSNQVSAQSFAAPQWFPFGLDTLNLPTFPAFADLDGDGDMDLLIGGDWNGMQYYYENTGTPTAPAFAAPQINPFGLDSTPSATPTFVDLDADGDMDLVVGEWNQGDYKYYENTGTPTAPAFAAPQINPFGISAYYYAAHAFADLDADGDMDLLACDWYFGAMVYYENTGTPSAPAFTAGTPNPFGLVPTGFNSLPAFADLDKDGDMDLLIGHYYDGGVQYFENTGTPVAPAFAALQFNPFGLDSAFYAFPAFADLDADGDMDLLLGTHQYFENTSTLSITKLSKSYDLALFPNPVIEELNIDTKEKIEKIEIFDLLSKTAIIENTASTVSLNKLNSGVYTVKITFAGGKYVVRKIQKQ